jgi:hypothetical protein
LRGATRESSYDFIGSIPTVPSRFARLPADEFGPLRWERYVCDGLTPVEDVTRLPDLPSDQIFQPIGCEPMPVD